MMDSLTSHARPRLIIADDDPVVRSMLGMSLGEAFEVVGVAEDAEAAVSLAEASKPDAALVDVEMPNGGGIHAVRGITAASPETAIVVLSADESDSIVRDLIAAGAVSYCRKGMATHDLTHSVTESIRVHRRGPVT